MKEGINPINPVKSEHLKEGVKPIQVCIGTPKDFKISMNHLRSSTNLYPKRHEKITTKFKLNDPEDIRWHPFPGFTMSEVNNRDKFSKYFSPCTGVVVKGTDKVTNKNLSFLSHQSIGVTLDKTHIQENEDFLTTLKQHLIDIKNASADGTIDAVIIGGESNNNYTEAANIISSGVKEVLGFKPVIINGPKETSHGEDYIYYDNENGRLYFIRPEVNQIKDFTNPSLKDKK